MADYHVLAGSHDGNSFQVVMHFPIPSAVNRANVNYRTALVASLGGAQPSRVPGLLAAEQTQLDAGELYEHVENVHTHPGEAAASFRDRVDALYTARRTEFQAKMQRRLDYWGFSRTVPT